MIDYYRTLEVDPLARPAVIEAAYKRLLREEHPDVNGGTLVADERTRAITQAYAILSVPSARANYDRDRLAHEQRAPSRPVIVPPISALEVPPRARDDNLPLAFALSFVITFLPGCFLFRTFHAPLAAVLVSLACGYVAGAGHVGWILVGRVLNSYVPGSNVAGWILGERYRGRSAAQRIRVSSRRVRWLVVVLRLAVGIPIGVVAAPFALPASWTPVRRTRVRVVCQEKR